MAFLFGDDSTETTERTHGGQVMRKLLLFLFMVVSILACLPTALSWAVELNMNGDFRVRGFYNNNLTDANNQIRDHNAFNTERFILNLEAKSGQGPINVQGVLTTDFTSFNGTELRRRVCWERVGGHRRRQHRPVPGQPELETGEGDQGRCLRLSVH